MLDNIQIVVSLTILIIRIAHFMNTASVSIQIKLKHRNGTRGQHPRDTNLQKKDYTSREARAINRSSNNRSQMNTNTAILQRLDLKSTMKKASGWLRHPGALMLSKTVRSCNLDGNYMLLIVLILSHIIYTNKYQLLIPTWYYGFPIITVIYLANDLWGDVIWNLVFHVNIHLMLSFSSYSIAEIRPCEYSSLTTKLPTFALTALRDGLCFMKQDTYLKWITDNKTEWTAVCIKCGVFKMINHLFYSDILTSCNVWRRI